MDEAPSKTGRAQKALGLFQTADPHQYKPFGRMRETARAAADPWSADARGLFALVLSSCLLC
jgi:hypothetical protein